MVHLRTTLVAFFVVALIAARPTAATTTVIDIESGALFEGIIDGFPGIASFDGEPDLAGNQLATAFKLAVTEERGIAEFPLSPLAGVAASAVRSVVLTFNIDDVLSTFGPGTDFSGRAAGTLIIHVYAGDGAIVLTDYKNIVAPPHVVSTASFGSITDATLQDSGPISFDVDVTADVLAILAGGGTHVGIVWRTGDSPTGTSLDDLGDGSLGPPGVGGARLPFLTVEWEETTPATATPSSTNATTPSPTATVSEPTPTATATTSVAVACVGDCRLDGAVTVDEVVVMVNVALGLAGVDSCPPADPDSSLDVTVDEIVRALQVALNGCF